jgi:dTDP-4-amino-4,6-dideoxygalactose transaminase
MYYIIFDNLDERTKAIQKLKEHGVLAVFHYISLHSSPFYISKHDGRELTNSDCFTDRLLRLPLFYELSIEQVEFISNLLK